MEIANESIFVSAIRSFCKVFFACIGLFLAFFLGAIVYSLLSSPYAPVDKTTLTVLPNLDGEVEMVSFTAPVVLRINIDGVVGIPTTLDSTIIEDILIDSRRGILGKDRVKAILLRVDTPGGGAVDGDNIYRMLKEYKERYKVPIYAYVDGLCASAGMLITSAADRMYASPPSIIGSIGVISGPYFNVMDILTKHGVQTKTLTEGIDKDSMSPFHTWKPDEGADLQTVMASSYKRFVDIVTQARPRLDREKLIHVYGAHVFDGETAEKNGYIDVANAEMKTALLDLMTAANIDPKKPYQVIELKPKSHWLSPLSNKLGLLSGKMEHSLNLGLSKEPLSY